MHLWAMAAVSARPPLVRAQIDDAGNSARVDARAEDGVLLDLLRTRSRQAVDDVHPTWRLVVGEPFEAVLEQGLGKSVDRAALAKEGRVLTPVVQRDPAHLDVTGTGLTHLGAAASRDAVLKSKQQQAGAPLTDSM